MSKIIVNDKIIDFNLIYKIEQTSSRIELHFYNGTPIEIFYKKNLVDIAEFDQFVKFEVPTGRNGNVPDNLIPYPVKENWNDYRFFSKRSIAFFLLKKHVEYLEEINDFQFDIFKGEIISEFSKLKLKDIKTIKY